MPKFIKLTNFLINANDIHKIGIYPNKYIIQIIGRKLDGFNWSIGAFGLGNLSTYSEELEICETKHSADYKIVSDWINKI